MLSACLPFKYRQTTDKETFKIFVWWMKWESYISYFYTIKLDWENEHKRGRVGRVAYPETILGDSCHCHGNYGFRVGRHDC